MNCRWLSWRLNFLGNIIVFSTAVCCIFLTPYVNASLLALALMAAILLAGGTQFMVRQIVEMETAMTSVERLQHYAKNIEQEPETAPGVKPVDVPPDWPSKGEVVFKELSFKYRDDLPTVLDRVSLEVAANDRVGICGRTGSGKSTAMLALYRIANPSGGRIEIDGVDTRAVPLKRLRSSLSIIPQESFVFSGSIRENLDPFAQYSDEEVWDALRKVNMREYVDGLDGRLQAKVAEGGSNMSLGQRQLICIARVLLRRSKIVLLDEATAAIDTATDTEIQKVLRENFNDCTLLVIAHRLDTISDSSKVLVLRQGRVAEYDDPAKLSADPNGIYSAMVRKAGIGSHAASGRAPTL